MSYLCTTLPAIESNKRRGWNRGVVLDERRALAEEKRRKSMRNQALSTIYSPPARNVDQASPPTTYASLPSGLTIPKYIAPKGYLKTDPLSVKPDNTVGPSRAGKFKPVTVIEDTPCQQKSDCKKKHGKDAQCKKCDQQQGTSGSESKSTPKRARSWFFWWRKSPPTENTEEPKEGWRCF
ncbi:hypothetical protein VFPPC_04127 [Pochonia chlamydosporia 170]|uniref:Uncharacterized protein n=1 Tax=Pochonia chlamydosporia 170 TaxID=1380566 RepID=A0A179FRA1_METCM|nr:hypothetical protein VFPPC_04127 [Pochonia chlamydosporia 170]OAQ67778.1 hypothetical protein VFPPC_04127 [Pochonia chlamydosporia 170]